jgi:hypothetical protein
MKAGSVRVTNRPDFFGCGREIVPQDNVGGLLGETIRIG